MTTYKIKKEITLTKLIKEIPDADGDKLAIQNSWEDVRNWFWNNKTQFFRYDTSIDTSMVQEMYFKSDEIIQDFRTIVFNENRNTLMVGDFKARGWGQLSAKDPFFIRPPGYDFKSNFDSVWSSIRSYGDGKFSDKIFQSNWCFTPQGFKFFKKYLGNCRVNCRTIIGNVYSEEFIKPEIEKGNITRDQVDLGESSNIKPVPTKAEELTNLNNKWKVMITEKFFETSWSELEKRWKEQKDAILNDPFFDTVKNFSEEQKKEMLQSIVQMYSDGDINTRDTMSYAVNSIEKNGPNHIFTCYEYLFNFMKLMDNKTVQLKADRDKLNQSLPGLFDKDGKLDENKLAEIKGWQNNQERHKPEDLKPVEYTDEDLKLFKELGIEDDQEKKECVKECYRLLEIYKKQVNDTYNISRNFEVRFAHIRKDGSKVNYDEDKLGGEGNNGRTLVEGVGNIITYLKLDRYDYEDKFRAGMVWFTMAHELSHSFILALRTSGKISVERINASHSLDFWKYFLHNSEGFTTNKLFKDNIKDKYWKEYFRLSLPSEFPTNVLIRDELKIYWPEAFLQGVWNRFPQAKKEDIDPSTLTIQKDVKVPAKKSDWVWKRLSSGLIELIDEEFKTGEYNKTNIDYIWAKMNILEKEENGDIFIGIFYRKDSALEKKIDELIDTTMGEKEVLTLSERQKITNLIGLWFSSVCRKLEDHESVDELVEENFKWISQSSPRFKEIFKEDWSAFMEQLDKQVEMGISSNYVSQYQEVIKVGNKLLEKVKDEATEALIEVPSNSN